MKQPSFDWKADEKYSELKNFLQEVTDIFESMTYCKHKE